MAKILFLFITVVIKSVCWKFQLNRLHNIDFTPYWPSLEQIVEIFVVSVQHPPTVYTLRDERTCYTWISSYWLSLIGYKIYRESNSPFLSYCPLTVKLYGHYACVVSVQCTFNQNYIVIMCSIHIIFTLYDGYKVV